MKRSVAIFWAAAILGVALLNIADILPDWTTFAAILTLPLLATVTGRNCCASRDPA